MKSYIAASLLGLLATGASAAPTKIDYTPEGGWESVDWSKVDYPEPAGGWDSVFNTGKGNKHMSSPFHFTSTYSVVAVPEQVVDSMDQPTGGLKGAKGYYNFGINSHEDIICYNITLHGFKGEYDSPAKTATHIHESAKGKSGPPRLAFPNPVPVAGTDKRVSVGCLMGPFTTGVVRNGKDTAEGFKIKQIEENPCAFNADVHSSLAVPGAVRGQLA